LLKGTGNTQVWLRIPLSDEDANSWDRYNVFRLRLENTSGLGVCLDIGTDLPDNVIF